MSNIKILLSTFLLLLLIGIFPLSVQAFSIQNITDSIKGLFGSKDTPQTNKTLTINSSITLVENSDINKNGQIDAGDIVHFAYTLKNTTESNYSFATLKTNIDSKQVSFIHNIHGATGIVNDGKTIEIPHVRLNSGEMLIISFDALINYFQEDKIIATEAEFVSSDNKFIAKSTRSEISAKKLTAKEVEEQGVSIKKQ